MTTPPRNIFDGAEMLTDNLALTAWLENGRKIMHAAALELGISASEVEARLRRVSGGLMVAGLSSRHRALMVARPIQQAAESLVVASRYLITANNRFEAAYMPELEQAGYRKRQPQFQFRGQ